jgi:uncharacterized UBP type Zn finger protein
LFIVFASVIIIKLANKLFIIRHFQVCRYCQQQPEKSICIVCQTSENLWICVLCGFVGCGR